MITNRDEFSYVWKFICYVEEVIHLIIKVDLTSYDHANSYENDYLFYSSVAVSHENAMFTLKLKVFPLDATIIATMRRLHLVRNNKKSIKLLKTVKKWKKVDRI